jgi:hypothetical protein
MIRNNYPTYEAGINLTLPIRNRAAQADNAQASLTQRQQEVQYRQTQNTIVLNVRQALIALVQDRAAVTAAEKAEMLAQQTLDDEQKEIPARLINQLQRGAAHTGSHRGRRHTFARQDQSGGSGSEFQSGDGAHPGCKPDHHRRRADGQNLTRAEHPRIDGYRRSAGQVSKSRRYDASAYHLATSGGILSGEASL